MKNQACSKYERLSKKSFLNILGNKAFSKPSVYGEEENYLYKGILYTRPSNEQYSQNKTRAYFEKLNLNDWSITSFDSTTRIVCVEIKNKYGNKNLSIKLPEIISKEV